MTHNLINDGPKIALFEPDIPQNTAAIIRTCACLGAKLEIIEPCGFLLNDKRLKRVVMDYMNEKEIKFYQSSEDFFESKKNQRIIFIGIINPFFQFLFSDCCPSWIIRKTKIKNVNFIFRDFM